MRAGGGEVKFKNKAHRSAYNAGYRAAQLGKPRQSPYVRVNRTSGYFAKAWLAGYDNGYSK